MPLWAPAQASAPGTPCPAGGAHGPGPGPRPGAHGAAGTSAGGRGLATLLTLWTTQVREVCSQKSIRKDQPGATAAGGRGGLSRFRPPSWSRSLSPGCYRIPFWNPPPPPHPRRLRTLNPSSPPTCFHAPDEVPVSLTIKDVGGGGGGGVRCSGSRAPRNCSIIHPTDRTPAPAPRPPRGERAVLSWRGPRLILQAWLPARPQRTLPRQGRHWALRGRRRG